MRSARPGGLQGCDRPLAEVYDVALVDLDGVVYLSGEPVAGAADGLRAARDAGMRLAFVTNNASRPPETVAEHLSALGIAAAADEVVTSAQAAATLLAERLAPGERVLVLGGDGLRRAVREVGLEVVERADDAPVAVAQGYTVDLGYRDLAEAALAIRSGALWVASNADTTIPTPRGLLPGNGALVAALRAATDRAPLVAGKPELPLHAEAVRRSGARRPLVVGDRLDTDIEGAVAASTDSLLVLTGVTTPRDLLQAKAARRPTYIAADLRALVRSQPDVRAVEGGAVCGSWRAIAGDSGLQLTDSGSPQDEDGLDALRALCAAAWACDIVPARVSGAEDVLSRLGLAS